MKQAINVACNLADSAQLDEDVAGDAASTDEA